MTEIVIGGDRENVREGTYSATLTALTTKTSPKFGGEFRVWTFNLADGSEVEGTSSMYTNPTSKPGRWMAALLGRKLVEGETVNFIGRPCLVSVIVDEKGYPKVDAVLPPMNDPARGIHAQPVTPMHEGMGDDDPRNVIGELP